MDGQGELQVDVISEIAHWYRSLPAERQIGVLGEGIEILRRRGACGADGGETPSLQEAFLDCFAEYVLLAVMHSRVDQRVRFLGFVPIDTLRVFYQSAAVFAFPSLYEGFGLPPLEAMAAGTPVVTSNVSSLPEVVGDAAVIVNPENVFDIARGLREALVEEELRRRLIEKGYRQVRRFSWERTASEVLEVYREVARGLGES